jgi:Tol biopolymer transport system component
MAWSFDGNQLAFTLYSNLSSDPNKVMTSLFIVNSDGSNVRTFANHVNTSIFSLNWSPDGNNLIYISNDGLHVIGVNHENDHVILGMDGSYVAAVWSPDGKQIAFLDSKKLQILLINADGSHLHPLTDKSIFANAPTWSPNSQQIAFYGAPSTQTDLAQQDLDIIDVDGTHLNSLLRMDFLVPPVWLANGQIILSYNNGSDYGIVHADGTGLQHLTISGVPLAWSHDGKKVARFESTGFGVLIDSVNLDGSDPKVIYITK